MTDSAARRAPRLSPDELIAPHITRLGRFRKINPTKARPLPRFVQVLAVVGWVGLVEETFRRARRLDRTEQVEQATPATGEPPPPAP